MIPRLSGWFRGIGNRVFQSVRIASRKDDRQLPGAVSGSGDIVQKPAVPSWDEVRRKCGTLPTPMAEVLVPHPVTEDRLFTAREKERELLTALAQASSTKSVGPTAITGPPGSGKTSLLYWLRLQSGFSNSVSILQFPRRVRSENELIQAISAQLLPASPCSTVDDLVDGLLRTPRRIVLVDDGECLMLRAIGFDRVMKAFLSLVVCAQEQVLWFVSFSNEAWKRLDYQYGFGGYFSTVIPLNYFSQEELRAAIARRLRCCSASVVFAGDQGVVRFSEGQAASGKEQDDTALLLDRLAGELYQNSGGNMEVALSLLLLHSRYDPVRNVLEIHRAKPMGFSFPDNLGTLDRLTLAETLVHGGLTIAEHSEIFQTNRADSRLTLERLFRLGLLATREEVDGALGNVYRVHPLVLKPVSTALTTAHILY